MLQNKLNKYYRFHLEDKMCEEFNKLTTNLNKKNARIT